MKRILGMMAAILLVAGSVSAATVPASLKSKVASDDQLASVRGGAVDGAVLGIPYSISSINSGWIAVWSGGTVSQVAGPVTKPTTGYLVVATFINGGNIVVGWNPTVGVFASTPAGLWTQK